jgi:hypothetical protein
MTSIPIAGGFLFQCDECGAEWKPPRLGRGSAERDWHECWADAKDDGWRAVKVKSKSGKEEWENRCPNCR